MSSSVVASAQLLRAASTLLVRRSATGATPSPHQLMLAAVRRKTHYSSGAIKPQPRVLPFGMIAVFASILPGLFVGAAVSKTVANFLEENELFVPSDDDDDED